jgi:hypothetical protein
METIPNSTSPEQHEVMIIGDFDSLEEFFDWVEEAQPIYYPEENQPNPDCNQQDQAAGLAATNLFNNTAIQNALSNTPILFPNNQPPYSQQNEVGFNINSNNGVISTTAIRTGTANGLPPADYSLNTIADYHTHSFPGASSPSAQDLLELYNKRGIIPVFTTTYVQAADGSKYALVINDPQKLNTFVENNPNLVGSDNNFNSNTQLGGQWRALIFDLVDNQGYSADEAQTRATALILKESGVSLLKSDSIPDNFKKIGLEQVKNPDGTSAKDANGNNIYNTQDCN